MHSNRQSQLAISGSPAQAGTGSLDLSAVMVAMNEEHTIGEALAAVKPIAREIIVVDSGSTDNTKEIALQHGAQVVHRDWKGYADQKNFALGQAGCSWVLNVDADEILSPQLVQEIKATLGYGVSASPAIATTSSTTAATNTTMASAEQVARFKASGSVLQYTGFKLPRVLYIGDTPLRHGGFYPDAQLRLIRKGAGRFNDRLVHESISIDGPVFTFKHHMLHKAYANIEEFKDALDKYAQLSAQEFSQRKLSWWHTSHLNQWVHPTWTFFYRYILRSGFLDGALGFKLACIYSNYVAKKIRYLRCATS